MDGIYNILEQRAEMQKDLILDGEQCVPLGNIDYYSQMDLECGVWPSNLVTEINEECFKMLWAFALENSYYVVTISNMDAYTEVILFEREDISACHKLQLVRLCVPCLSTEEDGAEHDSTLNYILTGMLKSHSKIIVL